MAKSRPKMVFEAPSAPPQPLNPTQIQGTEISVPSDDKPRQRSRIGKRAVTFYVSPEAFRQLGVLSAQTDRSIQDMMTDAVDWVFQQHGLARIAKG